MKLPCLSFLAVVLAAGVLVAAEPTHKLESVNKTPEGLSKEILEAIQPEGVTLSGPNGPVASYWLAKEVPAKDGFKPTLNVKYPFASGQFLGVMLVQAKSGFTDFRGQEIPSGVYTLRYGKQPEDGNHIGTSELYDFLLAIPAKFDTKPGTVADPELPQLSAKSAGATHPAIFSLVPADAAAKTPSLSRDGSHDFWIVQLKAAALSGEKKMEIPVRFVAIGRSPE